MTSASDDPIEIESAWDFETTLARVSEAIRGASLTVVARIDHAAAASEVGITMPPTTVLIYGNPRGGTPVMLVQPLTALDLPLRVLVRETLDGRTRIAFHPSDVVLRRSGVPDALADRLVPAQALLAKAIAA